MAAADPSPPIQVRKAKPQDLAVVVALDAAVTGVKKPDYWRDRLRQFAGRDPERLFLVAEAEGQVVGFILGEIRAWEFGSPPSGWIFAINVAKGARLDGVGTRLFEAICAHFTAAGVDRVRTMIAKDDPLVMRFFRSQGMVAGPFIELEKVLP
ncbi:MAG: GNAT family N-acetyltransferase [Deltaproteobacteria bacterium]|nr:GNAT family N-acetyltransferase [Deltaproteobacteria bacterium]